MGESVTKLVGWGGDCAFVIRANLESHLVQVGHIVIYDFVRYDSGNDTTE